MPVQIAHADDGACIVDVPCLPKLPSGSLWQQIIEIGRRAVLEQKRVIGDIAGDCAGANYMSPVVHADWRGIGTAKRAHIREAAV